MEFHLWLSLVVICILGALSPGPSLALVIQNSLNGGASQGYATAISHGIGVALYAAITATGIGLLIIQSPALFSIIKYAGAAFLLYLGIKALLSKQQHLQLQPSAEHQKRTINGWRDGFLIAFLNPKLAIFFLALFSQFVVPGAGWQQKMIMTVTVGIIDMSWYLIIAFTISRGPIIAKLRQNSHIVDKVTGSFLIVLAARVVLN
ncbi:Threonine/homoserine/homoserine lactone efflux protein [Colwellia chukchiensis]|uniref:Threonine/homoserine/homoserine lactone efflux protein n=1 Tax=Colwellia chukchiensis TaxID=641665 RepID=A0A1H7L7H9_9GAMM|nr:LysE family translocator [Colwellia chukchiensis]SEK94962.1 Threonine/homoserine/homoserine lactone efflux protein [Colwellia chukchiensis]